MSELTFKRLREINLKRAQRWHKSEDLSDWSIADWFTATTGELGEAGNVIKKLRRLESEYESINDKDRQIDSKEQAMQELGKELADTQLYLDLLACRCGINLEEEVVKKFNITSDKYGFPEKL